MRSESYIVIAFLGVSLSLSCREAGVGVEQPHTVLASLDVGGLEAELEQFDVISGIMECKSPDDQEKIEVPEAAASLTGSDLNLNFKPSASLSGLQCFVRIVTQASAELSASYEFRQTLDDGRVALFLSNYATVNGNEIEVEFLKTFNPIGGDRSANLKNVSMMLLSEENEQDFEALSFACASAGISYALQTPVTLESTAGKKLEAKVSSANIGDLNDCKVKGISGGDQFETDTLKLIADGESFKADRDYVLKKTENSGNTANVEVIGKIKNCSDGEIIIQDNGSANCQDGSESEEESEDEGLGQSEDFKMLLEHFQEYDIDLSQPISMKGTKPDNIDESKTVTIMKDQLKVRVVTDVGQKNFDGYGEILRVRDPNLPGYQLKYLYEVSYKTHEGAEALIGIRFMNDGSIKVDFSHFGQVDVEFFLVEK